MRALAVRRLLTFKRARAYAVVLIGMYVVAWVYVVGAGSPPLNVAGVPISGDYIAFHTAGRLLLEGHGAELYDRAAVVTVQDQLLGGSVPGFYDAFRNPPFAALPFVPLAALDLLSGFAVWSAVSIACFAVSFRMLLDEVPELVPRVRGVLLLVLAFPPLYFGVIDGENATISLLLFVLIYRALRKDEHWQAGLWVGLGLFKPQLFLLFPLIFVVRRQWTALLSFAVTGTCLAAMSLALVGVDGVQAWLRILVEPESKNALANAWRMASLKSLFDSLLPGQSLLALALCVGASALLVAALLRMWSTGRTALPMAWILTSLVAVLVDPHLVDYDLTVLIPAGVFAALSIPTTRWPMVLLYLLLVVRAEIPLGEAAVLLSPLALLGCLGLAWASLRAASHIAPSHAGRMILCES